MLVHSNKSDCVALLTALLEAHVGWENGQTLAGAGRDVFVCFLRGTPVHCLLLWTWCDSFNSPQAASRLYVSKGGIVLAPVSSIHSSLLYCLLDDVCAVVITVEAEAPGAGTSMSVRL